MSRIMKMKKVETNVLEDIICDWCGSSCRKYDEPGLYEYCCLHADWGYWSAKDAVTWDAVFCEACADRLKSFIEKGGGQVPEVNDWNLSRA